MTKTIFFIVGEPSADALGASLMRAMRAQSDVPLNFVGIGGPLMAAEGFESLRPMEALCVMGLVEVLGELPRLMGLIKTVAGEVEAAQPDALITIDLPDFTFQVVKRLRKRNFKTNYIHYIAPSVWAWRKGRAQKVARLYDLLLCAFPFEPDYFTPHGLDARFIGHSMVERSFARDDGAMRTHLGIGADERILGLFLGSRRAEFSLMAPILIEAVKRVQSRCGCGVRVLVPTLPHNKVLVESLLKQHSLDAIISTDQDHKWDVFRLCEASVAVSGTVALELAYLKVPHILTYRAHPVSYFIAKHLVKIKHIHLANIIMRRAIVPEFIQEACNVETLSDALFELLEDEDAVTQQRTHFDALGAVLGAEDAETPSEKAAAAVLDLLKGLIL